MLMNAAEASNRDAITKSISLYWLFDGVTDLNGY